MDLPFQLASDVLEGLNFLNEAIDEEITRKVIVNAVKQILVNGPGKNINLCLIKFNCSLP